VDAPDTRYAWNDDDALAYQVVGDGPADLVYLQGYLSNVILNWEHPAFAHFARELSRFSRLIVMDRRGLGCSERFTPADIPPVETLVDDLRAVLDEAESERPIVFATGDCGFIATLFAATYPDRLAGLVLYGLEPSLRLSDDAPWGTTDEQFQDALRRTCHSLDGHWSQTKNPTLTADEKGLEWCVRYERVSLSPGGCYADGRRFWETDVRDVLPSIHVPTLVLHRDGDRETDVRGSRYVASHIRAATLVEVPGGDHFPWAGNQEAVVREV
jgi:pimeloyl-ACP methyl ester carboxylesterase